MPKSGQIRDLNSVLTLYSAIFVYAGKPLVFWSKIYSYVIPEIEFEHNFKSALSCVYSLDFQRMKNPAQAGFSVGDVFIPRNALVNGGNV